MGQHICRADGSEWPECTSGSRLKHPKLENLSVVLGLMLRDKLSCLLQKCIGTYMKGAGTSGQDLFLSGVWGLPHKALL